MSDNERAREQAAAQMKSIIRMVAALKVDYGRLEELRAAREHADEDEPFEDHEELAELEEAAGDCENEDAAVRQIDEDPLSIEVRSDWHAPGENNDKPEEFKILLCTGGPAVQIRGELDQWCQPARAWLEYQDWFTPWESFYGDDEVDADEEVLLTYCRQFWFGE